MTKTARQVAIDECDHEWEWLPAFSLYGAHYCTKCGIEKDEDGDDRYPFCQCQLEYVEDELASNTCSACGKEIE